MKVSRTLLVIAALMFFATWIIGTFFLQTGKSVHIFIIVAAIFAMQAIIINPKPQPQNS